MMIYLVVLMLLILPSIYFLIKFKEERGTILISASILTVVGYIWDIFSYKNVWTWNEEEILGWFLGIPIDEFIFAFFASVFVIGIYLTMKRYIKRK